MLRKLTLTLSILSLGAVLAFWLCPATSTPEIHESTTNTPSLLPKNPATVAVQQDIQHLHSTLAAALVNPGPLPPSLIGTSQDVRLLLDRNGHFQPASDSLQLFEFYLAGIEEEPIATVLQRIHWDMAQQLKEPALGEARELLRRYLDYRIALMDLPQLASMDPQALEHRFNRISQLRQQHFNNTEYPLFFSADEQEDRRMLAQLANPAASAQIQQRFAQQLSPEQRESRAQITRDGELYARVEQLRESGASVAEIYQLREQTLGSQAAKALADLDLQRAQWQSRLADYSSARQRILNSGLAATDQQLAINQLLTERFDPQEQLRAQALTE